MKSEEEMEIEKANDETRKSKMTQLINLESSLL